MCVCVCVCVYIILVSINKVKWSKSDRKNIMQESEDGILWSGQTLKMVAELLF